MLIGEIIKKLRIEKGLTQEELATKLGLGSKSSIANYEKGTNLPSDAIKLKMCDLFNVSMDYLIGKSDNKYSKIEEDPLGLAQIGFSMKDYTPPTDTQKEQIKSLIEVIMKDNKKGE